MRLAAGSVHGWWFEGLYREKEEEEGSFKLFFFCFFLLFFTPHRVGAFRRLTVFYFVIWLRKV